MCTVSIITLDETDSVFGSGFRVVCNRDESRRRPPAAHPKWRDIGAGPGRAIWPMDLEAGGTWIAASQTGLVLCLLNLNPEPPVELRGPAHIRSRGLVIPHLLGAKSLAACAGELARMPLRHYAPFRLIGVEMASEGRIAGPPVLEARWDRTQLSVAWHPELPLCFVSSGLGDARVVPRLGLFEELVAEPGPSADRQDEFHRHVWPERTELSVLMSRAEARTVSITTLEVRWGEKSPCVEMTYEPVPDTARAAAPVLARTFRR